MEITEKLMLNLSLLLVLMFFFQVLQERQGRSVLRQYILPLYFVVSIFLCMIFSVEAGGGVRFDLRQVPIILGSLYTGRVFLFAGAAILMRGYMGVDDGFWTAMLYFTSLAFVLKWIHLWYVQLPSSQRIFASVLATFASSVVLLEIIFILHTPQRNMETILSYTLVPAVGAALITYFIEMIRQNILIRNRLARSEKMEAVSHMSAAISHEIRNPLTSVKGFLQLIQEDSYSEEKRKEFLQIAMSEIVRAEQVMNDYLTFSKAALDKEEELHVAEELSNVLKTFEYLAAEKGIKINASLGEDLMIKGDKSKFKQAVINLVKNALEAMPAGGVLTVRANKVQQSVQLLLHDTGIGMSEEQLSRLGEPYYSTKGNQGTGLGLMVTFSIIRAMKGKVQVNSRPCRGTTFRITFPSYKGE
ncbi:sensor histidine kinase [Bacillus massilinigeriensis]|uniref:sensor histidine kinase n=1 Tax=Bacillus mediterraneensis TaxID=1805474 RepID=UPI0008F8FFAE|nr:HAMP domain-containing sensor histidine kinase [Bacillus mediterraneensis]